MMINFFKNSLRYVLFSAVLILSGCAKNPYSPGKLDVVLRNTSESSIQNVAVNVGTIRQDFYSLTPGQQIKSTFPMEKAVELEYQYPNSTEGPVVDLIPISARPQDGGELVIEFKEDQTVSKKSRFDVY